MGCATIRANAELLRCKFGADPSDATEACTEIAIQQGLPSVDADRLACEAVALGTRDAALSCASARRSCSSDADCGGDEGSCVAAVASCTTTPDSACALVGTVQADCEPAGSCTWADRDGEWGCAVTDQDAAACTETASLSVTEDATACAAVTGAALDTATACEAVETNDSTDGAAKACTYAAGCTAATGKDACEAAGAAPGDCSWSPEWLREGFTGYCRGDDWVPGYWAPGYWVPGYWAGGQVCSYTGMVNSTAVSCGLSAAISAGDFPVQVSLNGQQFHDSSVQFHFTPVIFSLAGPPVGSDTGGSEVLIRGFGLSNVELVDLSQILCKFGDIETVPAASISDNG